MRCLGHVEKDEGKTSFSKTFLTFDYGKFRSDYFKQWNYYDAEDLLLNFHKSIYEGSMSFEEWENSFDVVAHTNQSAYIAVGSSHQCQVCATSNCINLFGVVGGSLLNSVTSNLICSTSHHDCNKVRTTS